MSAVASWIARHRPSAIYSEIEVEMDKVEVDKIQRKSFHQPRILDDRLD